jgi:hypothetical protein
LRSGVRRTAWSKQILTDVGVQQTGVGQFRFDEAKGTFVPGGGVSEPLYQLISGDFGKVDAALKAGNVEQARIALADFKKDVMAATNAGDIPFLMLKDENGKALTGADLLDKLRPRQVKIS